MSQNIAALLRHIEGEPPFTILDFGCGPGRDLKGFAALGHRVIGLEGAARFSQVSYDELLRDRLAYGTPDVVAERLGSLRDTLGLSGVVIEPNVGGGIRQERVYRSLRLFAEGVAPKLR